MENKTVKFETSQMYFRYVRICERSSGENAPDVSHTTIISGEKFIKKNYRSINHIFLFININQINENKLLKNKCF